jgi:hypothetical protein
MYMYYMIHVVQASTDGDGGRHIYYTRASQTLPRGMAHVKDR